MMTPEEMVERIADLEDEIKQAEKQMVLGAKLMEEAHQAIHEATIREAHQAEALQKAHQRISDLEMGLSTEEERGDELQSQLDRLQQLLEDAGAAVPTLGDTSS